MIKINDLNKYLNKGLDGTYSQNRGQGYRRNKKNRRIRYLLVPYIVQNHPIVLTLKIIAGKGGLRQNGRVGGASIL